MQQSSHHSFYPLDTTPVCASGDCGQNSRCEVHGSSKYCICENGWQYTNGDPEAPAPNPAGCTKGRYYLNISDFKGVLYSMFGPDLVGLTVAVWNIVGRRFIDFWSNWTYCCWIRTINVNFSIFCTLLYHTSLKPGGFFVSTIVVLNTRNSLHYFGMNLILH